MAISIVAEKIDISPKKNRTRTEHKKVKGEKKPSPSVTTYSSST